jgi:hypothetical protein
MERTSQFVCVAAVASLSVVNFLYAWELISQYEPTKSNYFMQAKLGYIISRVFGSAAFAPVHFYPHDCTGAFLRSLTYRRSVYAGF